MSSAVGWNVRDGSIVATVAVEAYSFVAQDSWTGCVSGIRQRPALSGVEQGRTSAAKSAPLHTTRKNDLPVFHRSQSRPADPPRVDGGAIVCARGSVRAEASDVPAFDARTVKTMVDYAALSGRGGVTVGRVGRAFSSCRVRIGLSRKERSGQVGNMLLAGEKMDGEQRIDDAATRAGHGHRRGRYLERLSHLIVHHAIAVDINRHATEQRCNS